MQEIGAEEPHPTDGPIRQSPDNRIGGRVPSRRDQVTLDLGCGGIVAHGGLVKESSKITHPDLTEPDVFPPRSCKDKKRR